jgi:hypothetical protein
MTDQADRERESRETELTKFQEQRVEEATEREESAERLQDEQEPDRNEP